MRIYLSTEEGASITPDAFHRLAHLLAIILIERARTGTELPGPLAVSPVGPSSQEVSPRTPDEGP